MIAFGIAFTFFSFLDFFATLCGKTKFCSENQDCYTGSLYMVDNPAFRQEIK